ncbi:hypothetical protein IFM89_035274 [Coptis chinensis]|uniref:Uncharacterized protein n=1 Tax=Coptis chinensis TaxID=261450 RepID=A0A835LFZ6_9MAGN|nr:hypothetical protein IFM89_035274 [Coptis chinensis]
MAFGAILLFCLGESCGFLSKRAEESFVLVLSKVIHNLTYMKNSSKDPSSDPDSKGVAAIGYDDERRTKYFLKDDIPLP